MFSKELFGQRILQLRKQHNETQKDLAELLDVGKGHISEIERENPPEASVPEPPVKCSKGGVKVDPDRAIVLECTDGVWTVVNEGY